MCGSDTPIKRIRTYTLHTPTGSFAFEPGVTPDAEQVAKQRFERFKKRNVAVRLEVTYVDQHGYVVERKNLDSFAPAPEKPAVDLGQFETMRVTLDITTRKSAHPAGAGAWAFAEALGVDGTNDTLTVVSIVPIEINKEHVAEMTEGDE